MLNSATATPSTFVLTAVITVPVTLASPVVIDESPTFIEDELCPVIVDWFISLLTWALLACPVVLLLVVVADPLLLESAPFPEFVTEADPVPQHPDPERLLFP